VASVNVPAAGAGPYNYAWFVSFGLSFAVYAGVAAVRACFTS